MSRYLLIELSSDGLAFETKNLDFYVSWFGIGLAIAGIIAVKVIKKYRRGA